MSQACSGMSLKPGGGMGPHLPLGGTRAMENPAPAGGSRVKERGPQAAELVQLGEDSIVLRSPTERELDPGLTTAYPCALWGLLCDLTVPLPAS